MINAKLSGMILPTAVIFTFVSMMVTMGYMERVLNKKINLDLRIAKTKARSEYVAFGQGGQYASAWTSAVSTKRGFRPRTAVSKSLRVSAP